MVRGPALEQTVVEPSKPGLRWKLGRGDEAAPILERVAKNGAWSGMSRLPFWVPRRQL
jgi:hypothetical protein